MYDRLDDVPPLATRHRKVSATHYNHVLIALKHLGPEIRMRIPKLKHLDLILQKNAWIIIDRALYDYPIVAWTNFVTEGRSNLHEDIECDINFYHANATMVMNRTLEAMELLLGEELMDMLPDDASNVVEFKPRNND